MFTLQGLRMKTEAMMEQMRRDAIDRTFEQFRAADRRYYETCVGGEEVTRLFHILEDFGVDTIAIVETDLEIREEVFGV